MAAVEGGLSLFNNPVGFVDHLASLESQGGLSEDQQRELLELVTAQYHRADDLLKPKSFTPLRLYNGRPRGLFRGLNYSEDVYIEEPFLTPSYKRVQINVRVGKGYLNPSPDWQDKHMMRISLRGSSEDRKQLTRLYVDDHFVGVDGEGKTFIGRRGFKLEVSPFNFRQLAANESF